MNHEVTLTVREQKRLFVVRWRAKQAAANLDLSLRQMRRLVAAYRRDGPAGLVHGNRGRPSPQRLPPEIRERLLTLVGTSYPTTTTTT